MTEQHYGLVFHGYKEKFYCFLIVVLCTFVGFSAAFGEMKKSVLLQYITPCGTTTKYKMTMDGETIINRGNKTNKTKVDSEVFMEQRIIDKDKKGNILMESEVVDGSLIINGKKEELKNVGHITKTWLALDGTVISMAGPDAKINTENQTQIIFSKEPVGIGDSWKTTTASSSKRPFFFENVYTIIDFTDFDGQECAKIKSKITRKNEPACKQDIETVSEGEIYFSIKKGIVLAGNSVTKMHMVVSDDDGNPVVTDFHLNMKMDIVKDKAVGGSKVTAEPIIENLDFDKKSFFDNSDESNKTSSDLKKLLNEIK